MEKINIRGVNFLNTTLDGAAEYIWQRFADGERLRRKHGVPAQIAQLLRRAGQQGEGRLFLIVD